MPAIFWDFAQRRFVVHYRRFGATYRPHLNSQAVQHCLSKSAWPLKRGQLGRAETSTTNYRSRLRQIPETSTNKLPIYTASNPRRRQSHLNCGGRLKQRDLIFNLLAYSWWLTDFRRLSWQIYGYEKSTDKKTVHGLTNHYNTFKQKSCNIYDMFIFEHFNSE